MLDKYEDIYNEIKAISKEDIPLISILSNVSTILFKIDNINWCGFYLVNNNYLYLGPFQGDPACLKIEYGKGVCGTAFKEKKSIIVDDVDKFIGHIRCSNKSKSEIVVPIIKNNKVKAVIDIDSPILNRFNNFELELLENISSLLSSLF